MGRELARLHPVEADLVVPVPDSGNYAALGFAEELGIPFEHAFVRNHYIGRTFLAPSQLIRDFNVRIKLNLIKGAVKGKRVVVVDDSIVRGTTARARVVSLREAGAKEVHMRVSCPPHRYACHYGIDFPDPEKLLANQLSHAGNLRVPGRGQRGLSRRGRAWCAPRAGRRRISASRVSREIIRCRSIRRWTSTSWSGAIRATITSWRRTSIRICSRTSSEAGGRAALCLACCAGEFRWKTLCATTIGQRDRRARARGRCARPQPERTPVAVC